MKHNSPKSVRHLLATDTRLIVSTLLAGVAPAAVAGLLVGLGHVDSVLLDVMNIGLLGVLCAAIWRVVLRYLTALDKELVARKQYEAVLSEREQLAKLSADVADLFSRPGKPLDSMYQECTELLVRHVDAAFARIWSFNSADDMLELRASAGMYTHIDGPHARIPASKPVKIARIAKERRAHLTNAVVGDPQVPCQDWAAREGMVSFAGYPMLVGEQLLGVMALFARRPLSESTTRAMAELARAVAMWTLRRRAEQEAEQHARTLEATNRELVAAKQLADAASRAKSDFLANMSHELRTPLHGVIGMTELLLNTELKDKQRRYVTMAKTAGHTLLALISDILDFSKIEAGKIELETIDFNLNELIENVVVSLEARVQSKGLELAVAVPPHVPSALRGDPVRLQQVLMNLMANAVKFTEHGEIVLRIAVESENATRATLRFSVIDSGIGIPGERLGQLFQAFTQVDASMTRQYGGTGLGLAISRRLIELMGGHIDVSSTPGVGSTFWFVVELEKSAEVPPPQVRAAPALLGTRVLAVDDNPTNREILHEHLTSLGLDSGLACDAQTALHELRAAQTDGRPYRLAILDFHMPLMNGVELAQAIKADPMLQDTVLIMLGSAVEGQSENQLDASGFAAWLHKPVWRSSLAEVIEKTLSTPRADCSVMPVAPLAVEATDDPKDQLRCAGAPRILLAEDNEIGKTVIVELLGDAGIECIPVSNGQKAVEMAASGDFDAVLMDCQMPVMNGFDATGAIRRLETRGGLQRGTRARLPIIALTANAMKGDRERCLEAGMDDYLPKPLHSARVFEMLASYVPQSRGLRSQAQPAQAPLAESKSDPPLDIEKAVKSWGMDQNLVNGLIRKFQGSLMDDFTQLRAAVLEGRVEDATLQAHSMKGTAGYLAAIPLRDLAAKLEQICRTGDLHDASVVLERLAEEVARCVAFELPASDPPAQGDANQPCVAGRRDPDSRM